MKTAIIFILAVCLFSTLADTVNAARYPNRGRVERFFHRP